MYSRRGLALKKSKQKNKEIFDYTKLKMSKTITQKEVINGEVQTTQYLKTDLLGKGGFAKCYKMENLSTKKVYAAKTVVKKTLLEGDKKEKLDREISIHSSLSHPNIVDFYYNFEDKENIYIMLDLCSNKSLFELLRRRGRLSEMEVRCYTAQIVQALIYLKQSKVLHRDLKLANLFLDEKMQIKLGDFGLATRICSPKDRRRTICGTPNYIAPEIMDPKIGHSYSADLWALGVVMFTLLTGRPPFQASTLDATYSKIKRLDYRFPTMCNHSKECKDLISKIFSKESNRIQLEDIMDHDFFNKKYPDLMPNSTLLCPPSISYTERLEKDKIFKTRAESLPKNIYHSHLLAYTARPEQKSSEFKEKKDVGSSFCNNMQMLKFNNIQAKKNSIAPSALIKVEKKPTKDSPNKRLVKGNFEKLRKRNIKNVEKKIAFQNEIFSAKPSISSVKKLSIATLIKTVTPSTSACSNAKNNGTIVNKKQKGGKQKKMFQLKSKNFMSETERLSVRSNKNREMLLQSSKKAKEKIVFKLETGDIGFLLPGASQFIISKDLFQIYVKPSLQNEDKTEEPGKLYDINNLPEDINSIPGVEKLIFNLISIVNAENTPATDKKPGQIEEHFLENAAKVRLNTIKNKLDKSCSTQVCRKTPDICIKPLTSYFSENSLASSLKKQNAMNVLVYDQKEQKKVKYIVKIFKSQKCYCRACNRTTRKVKRPSNYEDSKNSVIEKEFFKKKPKRKCINKDHSSYSILSRKEFINDTKSDKTKTLSAHVPKIYSRKQSKRLIIDNQLSILSLSKLTSPDKTSREKFTMINAFEYNTKSKKTKMITHASSESKMMQFKRTKDIRNCLSSIQKKPAKDMGGTTFDCRKSLVIDI
ncbi:unnamed protein product [Moneuplotes crassus]|uniref:Protein kinase domain-containing protein n=1 Tax=Euplotes crassus TaxID=5936 RepID=A0AAD1XUK9_EUPCR|nr:unnamed protein product [Moneuplotes crassus]